MDIGLIRDEANELTLSIGPCQKVPLLGENVADTVEQAQAATLFTSDLTDTTPVESISGGRTASSSSRLTPFATLVSLSRVQKLEAKMDTLLHHIQSWMERSIAEAEEHMERRMA